MSETKPAGKLMGMSRKTFLLLLTGIFLLVAAAAFPRKRDGEWYFVGQTIRCTQEGHCGPCTLGVFGIEQDNNGTDVACTPAGR